MAITVDTTTASGDATASPAGSAVVVAPSDSSLNILYFGSGGGNGPHMATAQSPYSTWSKQLIGAVTTRNSQAFAGHTADDDLQMIVTSPGNGPYYFELYRSVNSWSQNAIGPTGDPNNASGTIGAAMWAGIDSHNRFWYFGVDDVLATYVLEAGYYNGSSWTIDATIDSLALGEQNHRGVAAAIIGNYLVVVYDSGAGGLSYRRLDVSGVTLGSWSAAASVTGVSGISTATVLSMRPIAGGSVGVLAYDAGGIKALTYDSSTDTWGTVSTLSASANDKHVCLIPGSAGKMYAVWSKRAAANNYSIVGDIYSGSAWTGTPATLIASGANNLWPNGAYLAGGDQLALVWTQGTASPWSILYETVAAPTAGGGTQQDISGTASASAGTSLGLTDGKLLSGTGAASTASSLSLVVSKPLGGTGSVVSASSLTITVSKRLADTLSSASAASLVMLVTKLIAGTASASAASSLDLTVTGSGISGTAAASAAAQLALTVEKLLTGTLSSQASASLTIATGTQIEGVAAVQAAASLDLTRRVALGAVASSAASATLTITVTKQIVASAASSASASLLLTVVDLHYRKPTGEVTLLASVTSTIELLNKPTAAVELLLVPEGTVS